MVRECQRIVNVTGTVTAVPPVGVSVMLPLYVPDAEAGKVPLTPTVMVKGAVNDWPAGDARRLQPITAAALGVAKATVKPTPLGALAALLTLKNCPATVWCRPAVAR